MDRIWPLFCEFVRMSFLAIGGASATLADLHRYLVDITGWLSNEQFYALYAISQATPGPNVQFVVLFGWQTAGFTGAVASTLGMCGPTSILAGIFEAASSVRKINVWIRLINAGLAPMSIGLLLANGWVLAANAAVSREYFVFTAIAALCATRVHPLLLIGAGAAAAIAGP